MTRDVDWSSAGSGLHGLLRDYLGSLDLADLLAVVHHIVNAMKRQDRPFTDFARQEVLHALMHRPAGPQVPLTDQNRRWAVLVDGSEADPEQQQELGMVLQALPGVEGDEGAYYLLAGFDFHNLFPDMPVRVAPMAMLRPPGQDQSQRLSYARDPLAPAAPKESAGEQPKAVKAAVVKPVTVKPQAVAKPLRQPRQ